MVQIENPDADGTIINRGQDSIDLQLGKATFGHPECNAVAWTVGLRQLWP